jgi:hypothetical protein
VAGSFKRGADLRVPQNRGVSRQAEELFAFGLISPEVSQTGHILRSRVQITILSDSNYPD